jgi:hypothetical protein
MKGMKVRIRGRRSAASQCTAKAEHRDHKICLVTGRMIAERDCDRQGGGPRICR